MKNKNKDSNQNYQTDNFYLATFLISKEIQLINIDRTNPKHCFFIFKADPQIESLVHSFSFDIQNAKGVMVDARRLIDAVKNLKSNLYSG